jgi:hypothetical protein
MVKNDPLIALISVAHVLVQTHTQLILFVAHPYPLSAITALLLLSLVLLFSFSFAMVASLSLL